MGPVQEVIPQVQSLPIWVEYVKALGTPVVALIASLVAAVIAYRQWRTASNKLKLDFYDRRMEIYNAAIQLINFVAEPLPFDPDYINELSKPFGGAHWLLDSKVATYLNGLAQRCRNNGARDGLSLAGMTREEKIVAARTAVVNERETRKKELETLNKLFAPYLAVKH